MLVQIECPSSGRTSAVPSIMDSPTLARVERAMLRQEEGAHRTTQHMHQSREMASLNRAALTQSLIPNNFGKETGYHAIKRGLLWQQRDRLFSRWKERYFVLTRDYLHCFRRASGTDHRVTEMGAFLFKVKLADVERVEWLNRRTYSAVSLELGAARDGGGKVLLRATEGLEDWFELLEECTLTSKERRRALRMTTPQHFNHHQQLQHQHQHQHQNQHQTNFNDFKRNNNNSINSSLEEWLAARQKIPNIRNGTLQTDTMSTARGGIDNGGSVGEDSVRLRRDHRRWFDDSDTWTLQDNSDNRLSLLTDIDISSYDGTLEASNDIKDASMASYHRHNDDVFSVSRRGVTNADGDSLRGSFRSASVAAVRRNGSPVVDAVNKRPVPLDAASQFIKFRERSHSDIQRIDRRPWHIRTEIERRAIYN